MQERKVVLYKGYGKPTVAIPTGSFGRIRPSRAGGKAIFVPFMLGGDPSARVRFHPRPNPAIASGASPDQTSRMPVSFGRGQIFRLEVTQDTELVIDVRQDGWDESITIEIPVGPYVEETVNLEPAPPDPRVMSRLGQLEATVVGLRSQLEAVTETVVELQQDDF